MEKREFSAARYCNSNGNIEPLFLFITPGFVNLADVMKKTTLSIIVFCAVAMLLSCGTDGKRKPLMGGIRNALAAETSGAGVNGNEDNAAGGGAETGGKLEIPAPLTDRDEQILSRTGYTVSYNKTTMLPNWVAWRLTADRLEGTAKRPQRAFHADDDVPEPRAVDADYYNSGYDRGHMCPAADNKWSETAMYESFLFTNMCPQNHNLNVGDWNEMEQACRRWAKRYGSVYIVCGPILYKGRHRTIGRNKVVVPEAFFKVVLCMEGTPKAIGFIYKNTAGNRPKGDYMNSVDEVERITGIDFFPSLPDDIENRVEAGCKLEEW